MRVTFRHLSILLVCFLPGILRSQNAADLIRKWEDKFYGTSTEMEIRMTITRPEWTRTVVARIWTLGTDYALVLMKEPKRDAGTVYLKRGKEIWNYVPALDRTVKMPPGMMSQSWMGSDFTHDDLVRKTSLLNDYTHRITGTETVDGVPCQVIELTPREDAPVVWGGMKVWITADDPQQYKTSYYDEDGELINTLHFGNFRPMGGKTIPCRLEMIPAGKKGCFTVLEYISVNYNKPLSESFFSLQNMSRVQ